MQGNICPMKKLLGASNARGQTTKNLGFQSIQFENLQVRDGPRRSGVSGAETKAFCSLPASLTVMLTMTHLSSKPCTPLFNCSKAEAVSEAAKKEKSREVKELSDSSDFKR